MSSGNDRSGYLSLIRTSFLEFLAYRGDVVLEFFTYPLAFLGYFFFIRALAQVGKGPVEYTLPQLMTYYSLGLLLRMILNQGLDVAMSGKVASGDIMHELLKPLDFHVSMLTRFVGKGLARLLFYSMPALGLLTLCFGNVLQGQGGAFLWFLLFFAIGFWISFELQFLIGSLAFYITMNYQISWTLDMVIRLVSGLIIPLNLFPEAIARGLGYLPFQYLYFIPIQTFLAGAHPGELFGRFLGGALWGGALLFLNRLILARALRQLTIFGS